MLNMTNTNNFSDSQESAIMDEETYKDIEETFGGTLPVPEIIDEDFLDIEEEKYNLHMHSYDVPVSSSKENILTKEEKDQYYPELMQVNNSLSGGLNFQFSFGDGGTGPDWIYSQQLKKLFIKMGVTLPMRFTWEPPTTGLYLRTAMVFKLDQYKSDPVKRCHNHIASCTLNMDPQKIKHVVHCVNHASSIYQEKNDHLSILTPLCTPEAGSQYIPMCFKFLCKNSCSSGMNRRPTELVFTLEDDGGLILDRQKLLVRVCSCPKRDKQKEEADSTPAISSKRSLESTFMSTKKRVSSCDTHMYKIELKIPGKENYMAVYKFAYDLMAGQASRTGQHEFFKPYMDEILHKMP